MNSSRVRSGDENISDRISRISRLRPNRADGPGSTPFSMRVYRNACESDGSPCYLQVASYQSLARLSSHTLCQPIDLTLQTQKLQAARILDPAPHLAQRRQLGCTLFLPPDILLFTIFDGLFVTRLFSTNLSHEIGNIVRFVRVQGQGIEGVGQVGWERGRERITEGRKGGCEWYRGRRAQRWRG